MLSKAGGHSGPYPSVLLMHFPSASFASQDSSQPTMAMLAVLGQFEPRLETVLRSVLDKRGTAQQLVSRRGRAIEERAGGGRGSAVGSAAGEGQMEGENRQTRRDRALCLHVGAAQHGVAVATVELHLRCEHG